MYTLDWRIAAGGFTLRALTVRGVVVEDSYLAREGIRRVLEGVADVEIVSICEDLDSARDAVEALLPDVVIADVRLPPTHTDEGIRLAAELRQSHPEIGVVVLSEHADP